MSKEEFKVLGLLGTGSFGSVYKVLRFEDGLHYALKVVPFKSLGPKQKKNALNEVRVLASIKHQNIVEYHQAFFDEMQSELCLVMQLVDGGDLKSIIKEKKLKGEQFYQYEVWRIGHQILKGIEQLHHNSIIHRDIKPSNILISNESLNTKISDFNISTQLQREDLAHTQIGTPYYSAPQIWENESYAYECDIWSFGCLIYQMCCLEVPFKNKNIRQLYEAIFKCEYENIPTRFSPLMKKVIRMCICKRERRASMKELLRTFEKYVAPKPSKSLSLEKMPVLEPVKVPTTISDINKALPVPKYSQPSTPGKILDSFIIKKASEKAHIWSEGKSEKQLQKQSWEKRKKGGKKIPSFMRVVGQKYAEGFPQHQKYSIDRLSMRRRKLRMIMNFDC